MPAAHFLLNITQNQKAANKYTHTQTHEGRAKKNHIENFSFFFSVLKLKCIEYLCRAHRHGARKSRKKNTTTKYNTTIKTHINRRQTIP